MELDEAEHNLDMKLPLDLRCVYRIHNGQQFVDFHHYGYCFIYVFIYVYIYICTFIHTYIYIYIRQKCLVNGHIK